MVKALLKKQLGEIFRTYFYDPKKNKRSFQSLYHRSFSSSLPS